MTELANYSVSSRLFSAKSRKHCFRCRHSAVHSSENTRSERWKCCVSMICSSRLLVLMSRRTLSHDPHYHHLDVVVTRPSCCISLSCYCQVKPSVSQSVVCLSDGWTLVVETDARGRYYRASFDFYKDDDVADVCHSKLSRYHAPSRQLVDIYWLTWRETTICLPNRFRRSVDIVTAFNCYDAFDRLIVHVHPWLSFIILF